MYVRKLTAWTEGFQRVKHLETKPVVDSTSSTEYSRDLEEVQTTWRFQQAAYRRPDPISRWRVPVVLALLRNCPSVRTDVDDGHWRHILKGREGQVRWGLNEGINGEEVHLEVQDVAGGAYPSTRIRGGEEG